MSAHRREGTQLDQLRAWRTQPSRDLTLGKEFAQVGQLLRRQERTLGGIGGAWADLAPPALRPKTTLVGLNRGVLTVRVADAPAKFELDRWLRSGGELALIKRCPAGLTKVRLTI